jgi:hypothetical protein
MNSVEHIYLDIDGVLNKMPEAALNKIFETNSITYPNTGDYDIVRVCNKLLPTPITSEEFWANLDRAFWANIPQTAECSWLPELCSQMVGRKHVFLLSAPVDSPDCLAGKLEWVHKNLPPWLHRQFIFTSHKWVCASPSALLIDDYDKNIQMFKAYGGQTILVPRPWNSQFTGS